MTQALIPLSSLATLAAAKMQYEMPSTVLVAPFALEAPPIALTSQANALDA
jgi:hypothetical protein